MQQNTTINKIQKQTTM